MKKLRKILLKILLFWGIGHIITNYIFIWNVFDEIYYGYYGIKFFRPNYASYEYMPQWQSFGRDAEMWYSSDGFFSSYYTEEYLKENMRLVISMGKNSKRIQILFVYKYDEYQDCYQYTYEVYTKKLFLEAWKVDYSSEKEEIIMSIDNQKKEDLYDILLADWFKANEGRSRFSMGHLGIYRYVE